MRMPWAEQKHQGVAQPVDQSIDLGARPAFAVADRLAFAVLSWGRRRCAGAPARSYCRSSRTRRRHRRSATRPRKLKRRSQPDG